MHIMHPKLRLDFTAVNTGFPRVPQYDGFACSSTVHDLLSCFMSFAICFSWLLFFSSLLLFCLVLFVFLLFFILSCEFIMGCEKVSW